MINVILSVGLISHLGFSLGLNLGSVVVCLNQLIISAGRLSVGFGGARRTTQRSGTSLIIINPARAGARAAIVTLSAHNHLSYLSSDLQ